MRPLRLILLIVTCIVLPTTLFLAILQSSNAPRGLSLSDTEVPRKRGFKALFSFTTPSSLFPPSAIISLADDNSTFFVARPAAFGPLLPSDGLSGQLWVGSGFGDDNSRKGGASMGVEGELGCSDAPGWHDGTGQHDALDDSMARPKKSEVNTGLLQPSKSTKGGQNKRSVNGHRDIDVLRRGSPQDSEDVLSSDGTDDYLHLRYAKYNVAIASEASEESKKATEHADIQSLQESAEIAGKVVLLSRGGCGFLEKVKWTQRRGGIALIVGDNTRGGGLVTMYARGDTSNVSIPAIFTSHTTAHLLSSLVPPEKPAEENLPGEKQKSPGGQQTGKRKGSSSKNKYQLEGPTFTTKSSAHKGTPRPQPTKKGSVDKRAGASSYDTPFQSQEELGFLGKVWSCFRQKMKTNEVLTVEMDNRRPPASGEHDWILVEDWAEDELPSNGKDVESSYNKGQIDKVRDVGQTDALNGLLQGSASEDDFVIGVHDWRDPDLVGALPHSATKKGAQEPPEHATKVFGKSSPYGSLVKPSPNTNAKGGFKDRQGAEFRGGSITPGSGEYEKQVNGNDETLKDKVRKRPLRKTSQSDYSNSEVEEEGWISDFSWFTKHEELTNRRTTESKDGQVETININHGPQGEEVNAHHDPEEERDGLWVTLTPTSMSTSPFFDTLLVLVVSPLVTLTVVYALLLLRSRIRRRRWRAPKSVVERLPVRTYHIAPSSTSSLTTRAITSQSSSPVSSLALAEASPSSRPRPRSRTTMGIPTYGTSPSTAFNTVQEADDDPDSSEDERKGEDGWKRPYTGKQIECVVCLEEYIDGVSKVMSLPCGHEFHAECMYAANLFYYS